MRSATRLLLTAAASVAIASLAAAHPGPGVIVDPDGVIWVAHGPSHRIWKIDAQGRPAIAEQGSMERGDLRVPHHIMRGPDKALYTAGDDGVVWRLDREKPRRRIYPPPGVPGRIGIGGDPFIVAPDGAFISIAPRRPDALQQDRALARYRRDGVVEPFPAQLDGELPFEELGWSDFAWGPDGALYLTDAGRRVRRILPDGAIETIAGGNEPGSVDGPPGEARFKRLVGIDVNRLGDIVVADLEGARIRRIAANGHVSTLAGTGEVGGADGPADQATFEQPVGVAFAPNGDIIVLEAVQFGDKLRLRRIDGDRHVTTIAEIHQP